VFHIYIGIYGEQNYVETDLSLSISLRIIIAPVFHIYIGIYGEQNYVETDLSLSISIRIIIAPVFHIYIGIYGEQNYVETDLSLSISIRIIVAPVFHIYIPTNYHRTSVPYLHHSQTISTIGTDRADTDSDITLITKVRAAEGIGTLKLYTLRNRHTKWKKYNTNVRTHGKIDKRVYLCTMLT